MAFRAILTKIATTLLHAEPQQHATILELEGVVRTENNVKKEASKKNNVVSL